MAARLGDSGCYLPASTPATTEEIYGLRSQMTRAAVSIPSNIAEGSSRTSENEYRHFLEIALGSCFELDTQLIVAINVELIVLPPDSPLPELLEEEIKMLHGFIGRLSPQKANS